MKIRSYAHRVDHLTTGAYNLVGNGEPSAKPDGPCLLGHGQLEVTMRLSIVFSLLLATVCAEPLKNPPKVVITAVSEEPFQPEEPFDPDPRKEYTEGFYEWKYLSASVQSRVAGSTWGEIVWLMKQPESDVLLWNHGVKSSLNFQPGKPVLFTGMAPTIRNMAEYKASSDAKKGVGGSVVGWVVSIRDGKGRIIALKGSSAEVAESYKKSEDELLKQKRR